MLRLPRLPRLLRPARLLRRVPGPVRHLGWVTATAVVLGLGVSSPPSDAGEVLLFTLGAWVLLCALVAVLISSRLRAGRGAPRAVGLVAFVSGAAVTVTHTPTFAMSVFALIGLVSGVAGLMVCLYPIRSVRPSYIH